MHNSLCVHGLVFLREDLGMELLHHRASICLVFVGKYNLFSKELYDFTPPSNVQISSSVFSRYFSVINILVFAVLICSHNLLGVWLRAGLGYKQSI